MLRLSLRAGRGSVGPAVWVAAWALGVQASEVRGQTQILETHTSTLTTYLGGATGVQGVTPLATQRGVGLDGSLRAGSGPAWALAGNPFGDGVGAGQARIGEMVLATGAYGPFDVDWSGPAPGASRWVNLKWSGSYYIASYQYLGAGMLVGTTLDEPNVFTNLYAAGSPNGYGNLDRFNRVTTSNWTNGVTGGTDFYHVDLSYDNLGNIMTATDTIHADTAGKHRFDVDYSLDKLSRLTRADEGHLSGGSVSPRTRDERWLDGSGNLALSQTGNWSRRRLDLNGDGDFVDTSELDDTGTFNNANEWLTRDTDSNSSVNHTLTHDAVGNMTDDGKSYKYTYDAFGRLVTVKNQSNATVAEYKYNGLGHRTGWHFDADLDSDVDGSDPWVYFQYDERWRVVATWRGSDLFAKEQYVYHAAGARGLGGSSYIDSVILRDRDPTGWTISTADETSERRYYCQNWRADVSVILPSTGCDGGSGPGILEWVKYSAYGVPQAFSMADYNRDGAANSSDFNGTTGDYDIDFSNGDPRADVNFDGGVSIDDLLLIANAASEAAPRGTQSCASTKNRIGYAGYQWDPAVSANHVRHRVYVPEMGRWTRRDPVGYVDGVGLYEYVNCRAIVALDPSGQSTSVSIISSIDSCPPGFVYDPIRQMCVDISPPPPFDFDRDVHTDLEPGWCQDACQSSPWTNGFTNWDIRPPAICICMQNIEYRTRPEDPANPLRRLPATPGSILAAAIWAQCTYEHERDHVLHNDHPLSPRYSLPCTEARARLAQIACLESKKSMCGSNPQCRDIIEQHIRDKDAERLNFEKLCRDERWRRRRERPFEEPY